MVRKIRGTGQLELSPLIDDYQSLGVIREKGIGGYQAIEDLKKRKNLGRAAFVDLDYNLEGINPSVRANLVNVPRLEFNLRTGEIFRRPTSPSYGYSLVFGESREDVFFNEVGINPPEPNLIPEIASAMARRNSGWVFIAERGLTMPEGGKELREKRMRELGLTEEKSVEMVNSDNGERIILTRGRNHISPKKEKRSIIGTRAEHTALTGMKESRRQAKQQGVKIVDETEAQARLNASGFVQYDARRIGDGGGTVREDETGKQVRVDLQGTEYEITGAIPGSELQTPREMVEKIALTPEEKIICEGSLGANFKQRRFVLGVGQKPITAADIVKAPDLEKLSIGQGVNLPMQGIKGVVIEVMWPEKKYSSGAVSMKPRKVLYILNIVK